MQSFADELYAHMLGALPIVSGRVSKETQGFFQLQHVFKYDVLNRKSEREQLCKFLHKYMHEYVTKHAWKTRLSDTDVVAVVDIVRQKLNEERPLIPGWTCHTMDEFGKE